MSGWESRQWEAFGRQNSVTCTLLRTSTQNRGKRCLRGVPSGEEEAGGGTRSRSERMQPCPFVCRCGASACVPAAAVVDETSGSKPTTRGSLRHPALYVGEGALADVKLPDQGESGRVAAPHGCIFHLGQAPGRGHSR